MSKEISAKTFNSALANAVKGIKSMRGKVQELIAFSVAFYAGEGNGNTVYMTKIMQAVTGTAGINTRGVQAYLQEVANVRYVKDKDGNLVFKKAPKADGTDNPATFNSNVLATPWNDWVKENLGSNNAQADWTIEKYLAVVIKTLAKHEVSAADFAKKLSKKAA